VLPRREPNGTAPPWHADPVTSAERPDQAGAGLDRDSVRALVDRLRTHLTLAIDAWEAEVTGAAPSSTTGSRTEPPRPSRPAAVPPVRMEQLHRTPEPTADLDDLVDVLAPRLLDRLVPALREALEDRA
jgi:hypothetical protein